MKFTEEETFQLVELYGEYECLWNMCSGSYRNKMMRQTAEAEIVERMGKEGFGVSELKRKIKNLRCTYNQECFKILKSRESGLDNLYVPNVKWFATMDIILKIAKKNQKTEGSVDTNNSRNAKSHEINETADEPDTATDEISLQQISSQKPKSLKKSKTNSKDKPPTKRSRIQHLTQAVKELHQVCTAIHEEQTEANEHEAFGNFVAAVLKKLPFDRALAAQHEILGILTKLRITNQPTVTVNTTPTQFKPNDIV